MKPVYETWKASIPLLPRAEAEFEKWLFVNISGVLFGQKVGELLMLRSGQSQLSPESRLHRIAKLARSWRFRCRPLYRGEKCLKVIVYDPSRVQDRLSRTPAWFFRRLGYNPELVHTDFFREIRQRWEGSGRIPHEIGLALGYPLKDVLGFMGMLPLRYAGGCGWRIYGNPCRSLRRSHRFKRARQQALKFLNC
jgi:hypothetical protein